MQREFSQSIGPTFQNSEMCEASAPTTCPPLTLCVQAFPVKTLAPAAPDSALPVSDLDYGENALDWLARYDPATSSWKTSQTSFIEGLKPFSETWPHSGTMRNGKLYRRAPLVRHTHENACSLWPTPNRENGGRSVPPDAIWTTRTTAYTQAGKKVQVGLRSALIKWAGERGPVNPQWVEWLMGFPIDWSALADSGTP